MPTHNPNDPNDLIGATIDSGWAKRTRRQFMERTRGRCQRKSAELWTPSSSSLPFRSLAGLRFVVCFGMGKFINQALNRHDGPLTHWNQVAGVQQANMASNPVN